MQCSIDIKKSSADLQSQTNFAEQAFISSLASKAFDEKKFFSQMTLGTLSFVMKIAKFSAFFTTLCEKEEYEEVWKQLYSNMGLILSQNEPMAKPFFTHDEGAVHHFKLLRGAYYFHLSQQALEVEKKSFSDPELYWLRHAMKFESVHANQRYIKFLYQKLDKVSSSVETEKSLIEVIKLCKTCLNQYGSYAYMMLAEALFRYTLWAQQAGHISRARSAIASSEKACIEAGTHLKASTFSIHNASLGAGLKASNSYGFDSPQKAIQFLRDWAVDNLQANEPASRLGLC